MLYRHLKSWGCRPWRRQSLFIKVSFRERSFSSEAGDPNMSWESPPVHRRLSTIGIGPVFVCPPPYPLRPQSAEEGSTDVNKRRDECDTPPPSLSGDSGSEILTWEIIGDIKTSPEDFIVREIGWAPTRIPARCAEHHADGDIHSKKRNDAATTQSDSSVVWSRKIAGLDSEYQTTTAPVDGVDYEQRNTNEMTTKDGISSGADKQIEPISSPSTNSNDSTTQLPALPLTSQHEVDLESQQNCSDPAEGLRQILITCFMDTTTESHIRGENASRAILYDLTDLQNIAFNEIGSASSHDVDGRTDDDKSVWISIAKLNKDNRTLLHRYIRQAFPLLRTETSSNGPSDKAKGDGAIDSIGTNNGDNGIYEECSSTVKSWVRTLIDRTYFSISPRLVNPRQDLLALYKFRNNGPIAVLSEGGNRKSKKDWSRHQSNNNKACVLLRIRPDLPKNDRRAIHHALSSSRRREFETSTIHDVPCDDADKDSILTTAIVVQWSNGALHASQKKRRRSDEEISTTASSAEAEQSYEINAMFCILRKYQCEHQVAISNIVRALSCRVSDIGLAGMKDMKAITYQFCTLRDINLQRIHCANRSLGNRIQIMSTMKVYGSDSLLTRGKLIGNYFEITVRNLRRVKQFYGEGTQTWKEQMLPLHSSHLDAMVKRIRDFGFINFYGEQRVGDAGCRSHVGVRSFDVGRAMLQCDFFEAINLIMIGRSNQVYNPGPEEINARKVWKASGGDARQTLKVFPMSKNTMVRERDLMKGLVRYDNPLAAIRCIPHNGRMFWIHAYQSYVWNRIATERIRRWGVRPVVGDLYIKNKISGWKKDTDNVDIQVVEDPSSVDFFEVVLPLPGYNIQYPLNDIGELYKELLRADGVELKAGNIPEATAKGSYRKLIQKANNLTWTIVPEHEAEALDLSNPVVSTARFSFELEGGSYATMMLRELMISTMARDNTFD